MKGDDSGRGNLERPERLHALEDRVDRDPDMGNYCARQEEHAPSDIRNRVGEVIERFVVSIVLDREEVLIPYDPTLPAAPQNSPKGDGLAERWRKVHVVRVLDGKGRSWLPILRERDWEPDPEEDPEQMDFEYLRATLGEVLDVALSLPVYIGAILDPFGMPIPLIQEEIRSILETARAQGALTDEDGDDKAGSD